MTAPPCACAVPEHVVRRLRRDVALTVCNERSRERRTMATYAALWCAGWLVVAAFIGVGAIVTTMSAVGTVTFAAAVVAGVVSERRAWARLDAASRDDPASMAVACVWSRVLPDPPARWPSQSSDNPREQIANAVVCARPVTCMDLVSDVAATVAAAMPPSPGRRPRMRQLHRRRTGQAMVDAGVFAMLGCLATDEQLCGLWRHTTSDADIDDADHSADRVFRELPADGVSTETQEAALKTARALRVRDLAHGHSPAVTSVAAGLVESAPFKMTPAEVFEIAELVIAVPDGVGQLQGQSG